MTIVRIMLITLAAFVIYHVATGFVNIVTDSVQLNTFAPVMLVWVLVLLHGGYLFLRMIRGIQEMSRRVLADTLKQGPIPARVYIEELRTFVVHFATQKRWRACDEEKSHSRWLKHFLLVTGYVTMLVLILGMLWWFQTDNIYPIYHPQRWLGYYATIVLIVTSVDALYGRYRKDEQLHRFSQLTDWIFPAFILIGAVTGIMVHAFRYAGWPWPTYGTYVVHVMAMIAMLDTEVGVGQWAHLFYRPLALYLESVKQRARALEPSSSQGAIPAGTD
ncbi:MAG: hypothetical protein R3C44_04640 [Chloroflexota bacterium]